MGKIKLWFKTKKQLIKRSVILKQVEDVVYDYKETNIYDKYMKILTILVNGDEDK